MKCYKKYDNKAFNGKVFNEDALVFLNSQKSNSADIIFLDPPFNLGKKYDKTGKINDNQSEEYYQEWIQQVLHECIRVLTQGGALYIYHLPYWAMKIGNFLLPELNFVHWIAISMKNGFVRSKKLYPAHYALLFYTKGEPKSLVRPKILPKKCKNCGEYIKDYGGYKSIIDKKGINLSDFWEDLSPVRHSNTKLRPQNQLPELLTERILEISAIKNGIFIDPFVGTGTSIISAINHGMNFKANDLVKDNCDILIERINNKFKI